MTGNYAIAGQLTYLVSIDLGTETIADKLLTGIVNDVQIIGDIAYLANADKGLRTVDISDPENMVSLASVSTSGVASRLVVASGLAFIASEEAGLRIVDVSNPSAPAEVGSLATGDAAYDVDVAGDLAVVGARDGVHVVDVSNPAMPSQVGFYDLPSFAGGVHLEGDVAYVTTGNEVVALGLGTPSMPVLLAERAATSTKDVAKAGDLLYVGHTSGFFVLDVGSLPAMPVVASIPVPGSHFVHDLFLDGETLLVSKSQLTFYDLTSPPVPQEVASITPDSTFRSLSIAGDTAWLATFSSLAAADLVTPEQPTLVTRDDSVGAQLVLVRDGLAYVFEDSSPQPEQLLIFDLGVPATPTLLGSVETPDLRDFKLLGDHLFATTQLGLLVIDVADPADPQVVTTSGTENLVEIVLDGNLAYAVGASSELRIFDLSTPTSPVELGDYQSASVSVRDVELVDGVVVLATWDGLEVIDVSDPADPQLMSSRTDGPVNDLLFISPFLYAAYVAQIQTFDLTDVGQPALVSTQSLSAGDISRMAGWKQQLVAGGEVGLAVLDRCDAFADGFETGDTLRWSSASP